MKLDEVPPNLGTGTTDGINDAYEALVYDQDSAQELATLLKRDPKGTIRRAIRMDSIQRETLAAMSEDELQELVAPVLEALDQPDPTSGRLVLGTATVPASESASGKVQIKTVITVEFSF
jgi:hypothetical protein